MFVMFLLPPKTSYTQRGRLWAAMFTLLHIYIYKNLIKIKEKQVGIKVLKCLADAFLEGLFLTYIYILCLIFWHPPSKLCHCWDFIEEAFLISMHLSTEIAPISLMLLAPLVKSANIFSTQSVKVAQH